MQRKIPFRAHHSLLRKGYLVLVKRPGWRSRYRVSKREKSFQAGELGSSVEVGSEAGDDAMPERAKARRAALLLIDEQLARRVQLGWGEKHRPSF